MRYIVSVSGLSGSGKSVLLSTLMAKGLACFSISKIFGAYMQKAHPGVKRLSKVNQLEKAYKLIEKKRRLPASLLYKTVNNAYSKIIFVDSIRSPNDLYYFKSYKYTKIKIFVWARYKTRLKRVIRRDKFRNRGEAVYYLKRRDSLDLEIGGIKRLFDNADFILVNEGFSKKTLERIADTLVSLINNRVDNELSIKKRNTLSELHRTSNNIGVYKYIGKVIIYNKNKYKDAHSASNAINLELHNRGDLDGITSTGI